MSWQFLSVNRHSKLFYKQGQFQNEFHCEKCEYKSSSKTLLNNHKTYQHKNEKEISHIEDKTSTRDQIENETETKIRKRFTCEVCTFKSTNENSLKMHINTNHAQENKIRASKTDNKRKSTRIQCEMCDNKFNKKETFEKHMKIVHQKPRRNETENEVGKLKESITSRKSINSNKIIKENEVNLRATATRKKESQ